MRTTIVRILAAGAAAVLMAPAAQAQSLFDNGLTGDKLAAAIKLAEASPLGSEKNPVRVNMPAGERGYLARLRCADGAPPRFERAGSVGIGVYGNILDLYDVQCTGADKAAVYMDMYHRRTEDRPVPGFTIAD